MIDFDQTVGQIRKPIKHGDQGDTDHLLDLRGEDLHQGLGGQLPHRVVLDWTPGQV